MEPPPGTRHNTPPFTRDKAQGLAEHIGEPWRLDGELHPSNPVVECPQRASSSPCHCCPVSSTLPSYHSPLGISGASHKKPRPSQKASRVSWPSPSLGPQLGLVLHPSALPSPTSLPLCPGTQVPNSCLMPSPGRCRAGTGPAAPPSPPSLLHTPHTPRVRLQGHVPRQSQHMASDKEKKEIPEGKRGHLHPPVCMFTHANRPPNSPPFLPRSARTLSPPGIWGPLLGAALPQPQTASVSWRRQVQTPAGTDGLIALLRKTNTCTFAPCESFR